MKKTRKPKTPLKAEKIALMADKGRNISKHFTNTGKMMPAIPQAGAEQRKSFVKDFNKFSLDLKLKSLKASRG